MPGTQLWVQRYNGPANGDDSARSVAVSADGAKVYVTGGSRRGASGDDHATIALQRLRAEWYDPPHLPPSARR